MTEQRRGRVWSKAQWILLPVVVLTLCEALVRLTMDRLPLWYGAAARIAERAPIDAIFIGSSRVMASVTTDTFSNEVAAVTGRRLRTLNLGRGYTTTIEHYLGLRNLILAYPHNLRGVTVFVEAPGGLGPADKWRDPWVNPEQYQLLVDLLQSSDLPEFWRSAGDGDLMKLRVTTRFMARYSAIMNRRERLRELLLNQLIPSLFEGRAPSLSAVHFSGEDLEGPGLATGIRADQTAFRAARELAQRVGAQWERSSTPTRNWPGTVVEDLLRLVQQVDGHVVFFVTPDSEVFRRGYHTKMFQEDAAIFSEQVRKWRACLVQPAFSYTDADLPDLWHLRPERSPAYSQVLAKEWLTECRVVPRAY